MVPLEKAARKLKLSLEALKDRLREHGITIARMRQARPDLRGGRRGHIATDHGRAAVPFS
jgi:hypothetical protein